MYSIAHWQVLEMKIMRHSDHKEVEKQPAGLELGLGIGRDDYRRKVTKLTHILSRSL